MASRLRQSTRPAVAIVLAASSVSVIFPVLKDANVTSSRFGQLVLAAASVAEFGAIILLAPFFSGKGSSFRRVGLVEFPSPGMWSIVLISQSPSVDIAAVLPGQCDGVGSEPLFVFTAPRYLALRRAVLSERRTGATLGDAKHTTNMLDAGTPTRRAQ